MGGSGRLLCVTAATCIDRYVRVRRFRTAEINVPESVCVQPGGKGINVARTARALGVAARVVGHAPACVRETLDRSVLPARWSHAERGRQCLCILDEQTGELTELYEPIPPEPPEAWHRLHAVYSEELRNVRGDDVVAFSGRLPDGWPDTALRTLVSEARALGATTVVDTDDSRLAAALSAGPDIVKINATEAGSRTGRRVTGKESADAAARDLQQQGAGAVIVTLGGAGCVYLGPDRRARHCPAPSLPRPLAVGSGDAFLAGLARGLLADRALDDAVRLATATATASAARFVVGDIDERDIARLLGPIAPGTPAGG